MSKVYHQRAIPTPVYSTGAYVNKKGIKDPAKLAQDEYTHSSKRMSAILQDNVKVTNIKQLKDIHHMMFHKFYHWAGLYRNIEISKNGYHFLPRQMFRDATKDINNTISSINYTKHPSTKQYAKLLTKLNDMHPFREGNGRAIQCFTQKLAINHGQFLKFDRHNKEVVQGFNNRDSNKVAKYLKIDKLNSPMDKLYDVTLQKVNMEKALKKKVKALKSSDVRLNLRNRAKQVHQKTKRWLQKPTPTRHQHKHISTDSPTLQ